MSLNHLLSTAEPKLDLVVNDLKTEGALTVEGALIVNTATPAEFDNINFSGELTHDVANFSVSVTGTVTTPSVVTLEVNTANVEESFSEGGLNLVASGVAGTKVFGAFYPQALTTVEINALPAATYRGGMFYDTTTNQLRFSNATTWVALGP